MNNNININFIEKALLEIAEEKIGEYKELKGHHDKVAMVALNLLLDNTVINQIETSHGFMIGVGAMDFYTKDLIVNQKYYDKLKNIMDKINKENTPYEDVLVRMSEYRDSISRDALYHYDTLWEKAIEIVIEEFANQQTVTVA